MKRKTLTDPDTDTPTDTPTDTIFSMALILVQLLNGISLGMIYVLMAVGLTIVFGMLNIINFAHGAVYALGAYMAFTFATLLGQWTGSFWVRASGI